MYPIRFGKLLPLPPDNFKWFSRSKPSHHTNLQEVPREYTCTPNYNKYLKHYSDITALSRQSPTWEVEDQSCAFLSNLPLIKAVIRFQ